MLARHLPAYSSCQPDPRHRLVLCAKRCLRFARQGPERYVLHELGRKELERVLLELRTDPSLPSGVLGLISLALVLHEEQDSPTAARAIARAIERVRAELCALDDTSLHVRSRVADASLHFTRFVARVTTRDPRDDPPSNPELAVLALGGVFRSV